MMHTKWIAAALAACLTTPLWAAEVAANRSADAAGATGSSVESLSAAQIVERNTQARGGLSAWRRIQTMSMSGQLDAGKPRPTAAAAAALDPLQAKAVARAELRQSVFGKGDKDAAANEIRLPFRMDLARPFKSRLEIPFQGATAIQVFDGSNGWKLRPFLGRHEVESFSADELKAASQQQALDGPLIDSAVKGTQVSLEGTELVEGRNTYKLKLVLKSGETRHLWVDAQSFLDVRIDGVPRRLDGRLHPVFTYFRDYKTVDGLVIAHQLETAVQGVPGSQRIVVEKVTLNPVLEASRFAKPM